MCPVYWILGFPAAVERYTMRIQQSNAFGLELPLHFLFSFMSCFVMVSHWDDDGAVLLISGRGEAEKSRGRYAAL